MGTPGLSPQTSLTLTTMYKISNDIIYVNESKYFTPGQKLRLMDLMVLNILLNIQVPMYLNTSIFLEQWGDGIAFLLTLYLLNL